MSILSRIIEEAAGIAIRSQEHLGLTTALSLNFAVQAMQDNNPEALISTLMKEEGVSYSVAKVMLTSNKKLNAQAQWEINKMLDLMDGDYYFYSHCQQVVVFKHGDLFKEQIRYLQKHGISLNPLEQADLFVKTRDLFKLYCDVDIDVQYWDLKADLETNLRAVGINNKLVLDLYLNKAEQTFKYTQQLADVWNRRYMSNLFKTEQREKLFRCLMDWVMNPSEDESHVVGVFLSIAFRISEDSTYLEWASYPGNDRVKFAFWLMRYKSWYADATAEFIDKVGVYVNYTHHELVEHCFHNPKLLPESFSYKDHPKDIYAKAIPHLIAAKVVQLYGHGKCRSYPSPLTQFSNLPKHWEYIGTEFRQISEGQLMRHCCGGEGYRRKRENDHSIFFHVTTDEPHGLTVELTKADITVAQQQYHYTHQERFCKLDNIDNFVFSKDRSFVTYRIEQVKGYRNRQPTEKEMSMLRCELFGISNNEVLLPPETVSNYYLVSLGSDGELKDQWHMGDPNICFLMAEAVANNDRLFMVESGKFIESVIEKREWVQLDQAIIAAGGEAGVYLKPIKKGHLSYRDMIEMQMEGILDESIAHQYINQGLARTTRVRADDAQSRRNAVGNRRLRTVDLPGLFSDPLWQAFSMQVVELDRVTSEARGEGFLSVTNADEQFEPEIESLSSITDALTDIDFGGLGMTRTQRTPFTPEQRPSLKSILRHWEALGIAKGTAICRLVKTADTLENAAISNRGYNYGKSFSGILNPSTTTYLNLSNGE